MKLSLNWIGEHVALDGLDADDIANRLTLATAEIEGMESLSNAAGQAVVGEVVRVRSIADSPADHLHEVEVDTGAGHFVTVTGARAVCQGLRVAFAPPGAELPGGRVGRETATGRQSDGVLCSPRDLGLGDAGNELLLCPPDAPVGTRLSNWIQDRDVLLEVDNKSLTHRPDLWGHYGFARELAAIYERDLRPLRLANVAQWDALPEISVEIDDQACPCFCCIALDISENATSPLRLQARLLTLGQQTMNVLVDVTNYVALELGQPTHIYDRDRVDAFRVASLGEPGTFVTLDGKARAFEADDLMISSASEPVGIAGIMGGLESGVSPATTHALVESANFRAARVRKTSVRLGLRTDASQRFEKSQPPANAVTGARRIVALLEDAGTAPCGVSRLTVRGDPRDSARRISMPANYVSRIAGAEISDDRVTSILKGLGFGATFSDGTLHVDVPPFRSEQDVSIPADVLEEVLRVHGYGAIPPRVPTAVLAPTPLNPAIRREHKVRRLLAQAHGASEIQTYAWMDDGWLGRIGFEAQGSLRLRNPPAPQFAQLRTTLLPNVLKVAHDTAPLRESFFVFEVGRVFDATSDERRETTRLAGVSARPDRGGALEEHYRAVKGALEDIAEMVAGRPLRADGTAVTDASEAPWRAPDLWTRAAVDDRYVGELGVLYGDVLRAVAPQRTVIWFELMLDELEGPLYPVLSYKELPVYPGSYQDFSILWDASTGWSALEAKLLEFKHELLRAQRLLFLFDGSGMPEGSRSYTVRFWLEHRLRTLTTADLDAFRDSLLEFLNSRDLTLR